MFGHTIRTGEPAFDLVHGQDYWDYMAAHPEESARFDRSQQAMTGLELRMVLRAYDWSGLGTVVDVGGGNGAFLAGLLAHNVRMRGVVVDLPHVVTGAPAVLRAAGVADRCEIVGRSFFEPLPEGADAYVVKRVLWGYHDDQASSILRNVRAALPPDGRLIVVEPVIEPGDALDLGKILDLQMLVLGGGFARTRSQMRELLAGAGLAVERICPALVTSVVDARAV
jgi:SAM-dependent methyltransferase